MIKNENSKFLGDSLSNSNEEFMISYTVNQNIDKNYKFLGDSLSFSREEFKRSFAPLKGDN